MGICSLVLRRGFLINCDIYWFYIVNVLKQMKNQFSDFYFLSYWWFCSQSAIVFNQSTKKIGASQKMCNLLNRIYVFICFFVRFFVFEIWSILYFTLVMHSVYSWIHCWIQNRPYLKKTKSRTKKNQ